MKRIALFLVMVVVVFMAGCASPPSTPVNTNSQPVSANANTGVSFDGLWELPNGSLMLFIKHAFIFQNNAGEIANTGTFKFTNSKISLNIDPDSYADLDYTVVNSGTIRITSTNNSWANGNWIKDNDYSWNANAHPLVGYYERKTEDEIRILNITPFGWGDDFTCDLDYNLTDRSDISYDENNHSEFKVISYLGDGISMSFSCKYVFDGEDLLIGGGDDISRYNRYIKIK